MNPSHTSQPKGGLFIIALFKLIKGSLLLLLAVGALGFLHRDVQQTLEHAINHLRVDPHNKYLAALLAKAGLVDDRHLKELSGLVAVYAGLYLTEGVGLLLRKRWAEYLTVIGTAFFVPIKMCEITRHCTTPRVLLLLGNLFIVVYLIVLLRKERKAN